MYYTENNNICLDIIKHVRQIGFLVRNLREQWVLQVECIIFCCIETTNRSAPIQTLKYTHTHTKDALIHIWISVTAFWITIGSADMQTKVVGDNTTKECTHAYLHQHIHRYTYIYVRACIYKNTIWIKRFLMPRTRDVPLTYVHFYTSVGLIAFYF